MLLEHAYVHFVLFTFNMLKSIALTDRCEIRTRATEVTGALNQRLRPLGQPALILPSRELESVCKLPLAFTLIENKGREDAPRYQGYTGCSSYGGSRSSVNDLYNHHTVDWKW